jgi:twitching motility protein PilT
MAGLGDILVQHGDLTQEQLAEAEARRSEFGGSLAKTLVQLGFADEAALVRALATSMDMPYLEVDGASVDPNAVGLLTGPILRDLQALPVGFDLDDSLLVAVSDPNRNDILDKLQTLTGLKVRLGLAPRRTLADAIQRQSAMLDDQQRAAQAEAQSTGVPQEAQHKPVATVISEDESSVDLDELLKALYERGGSDLHLTVGVPPTLRIDGDLTPLDDYPRMTAVELQKMLYSIMTQKQREAYENHLELDMSYSVPGLARFRVNIFQQRDAIGSVMRLIPYELLPLDKLGIPDQVSNFAYMPRGFVLVTGPTGSGKSTTLASLIDLINTNRPVHIMTVEDPIEFLHKHKRAVVNQREVGTDTHGFTAALKHVLRQDPDVILVGEMRDLETIQIALTAAETGHLVFGTLHTQDAPQTIDRIIDVFPPHQQEQIRVMLSGALKGVVCQTLMKSADGKGRTAACEVLMATSGVRNLIREGKTHQIYSAIQAGAQHGMVAMDQSLATLVKQGKVTYDAALEKCNNMQEFNRLVGRT